MHWLNVYNQVIRWFSTNTPSFCIATTVNLILFRKPLNSFYTMRNDEKLLHSSSGSKMPISLQIRCKLNSTVFHYPGYQIVPSNQCSNSHEKNQITPDTGSAWSWIVRKRHWHLMESTWQGGKKNSAFRKRQGRLWPFPLHRSTDYAHYMSKDIFSPVYCAEGWSWKLPQGFCD